MPDDFLPNLLVPAAHRIWSYCFTNSDSRRAVSAPRPWATCWYRSAIAGVVCPSRCISSTLVAPDWAASTEPTCLSYGLLFVCPEFHGLVAKTYNMTGT
jgi:hypothetical protein